MKNIKLSEWARQNSYTYRGAFGLYQKGLIPGAKKLESGSIIVEIQDNEESKVLSYCFEAVSDLKKIVASLNQILNK